MNHKYKVIQDGECESKEINKHEEHKKRHQLLHKHLDELAADFVMINNKNFSKSSILQLIEWSYKQTQNPEGEI